MHFCYFAIGHNYVAKRRLQETLPAIFLTTRQQVGHGSQVQYAINWFTVLLRIAGYITMRSIPVNHVSNIYLKSYSEFATFQKMFGLGDGVNEWGQVILV